MADQHDDGGLTALVMQCAFAVIAGQKTVTISSTAGKAPAGFPRGELLSVGTNGAHNYAVCPIKALAWVHARTSGVPASHTFKRGRDGCCVHCSQDWIKHEGADCTCPSGVTGREEALRRAGAAGLDPDADVVVDGVSLFYELHGYLVFESKFGGHWDFHPKDELPAGDFLNHREHTPVYVRGAGVPTPSTNQKESDRG